MKPIGSEEGLPPVNRHLLVAVDESENSRRVVHYISELMKGVSGCRIVLFSIIPDPSDEYFDAPIKRSEWIEKRQAELIAMLEGYKNLLVGSGFEADKVAVRIDVRYCPSIAECILEEARRHGCSTIVVGRRGVSKREELIFGSTSSGILHMAQDCTVWVVE